MSTYNLNDQAGDDYFEFILDSFKYRMAYPTSKEVMLLSDVTSTTQEWKDKISKTQKKLVTAKDSEKEKLELELQDNLEKSKLSQTSFIDWCMKYVSAESTDAPNVKDALMSKNVKYLLAFMNMVQSELNDVK